MRRDKTPLLLMEQLVTLLVFALAAAICLQAFVTADRRSRTMEAKDRAAVLCQNTAETLRNSGGDLEAALTQVNGTEPGQRDGFWVANYDENWKVITYEESRSEPLPIPSGRRTYTLWARELDSGLPGLGKAEVWCRDEAAGEELFRLIVAWQEVTADE